MNEHTNRRFLDGWGARVLASLVVVLCVFALGYLNRGSFDLNALLATRGAGDASVEAGNNGKPLNPEFAKCRDERVGQVERMLSEGVINDAKFVQFKERAVATCAGQFPPGG